MYLVCDGFVAAGTRTMPRGCTMGPAGSVDFEDLMRSSRGGYFVDPDFPADETSIWTEGTRSGFGCIMNLPSKVSAWCLVFHPRGEVQGRPRYGSEQSRVCAHLNARVARARALPPAAECGGLTCDVVALRCAAPLDAAA